MTPLSIMQLENGQFSLVLEAGTTESDEIIEDHDHEPNGYFWDGVAQFLISGKAPELHDRVEYDSEAGTFVAYGDDRAALEQLGALLAGVANDPEAMSDLIAEAEDAGFEFDD